MIQVKTDNGTLLVIDFEGLLSKCEEEVTAYKVAGKNNQTVARTLGKSPETVNKQLIKAYAKVKVSGTTNPLAALQLISFKNGWIRFIAIFLMVFSIGMPGRSNLSGRASLARVKSSREYLIFETA
jgi:DNA-binding CsgD family transcriptional regulator